jgi:hypothetical protein
MANKYIGNSKVGNIEEKKESIFFAYTWYGDNNIPDFVEFPDGKKKKIKSMRTGTIIFIDGTSGKYLRTKNGIIDNRKTITITYEK